MKKYILAILAIFLAFFLVSSIKFGFVEFTFDSTSLKNINQEEPENNKISNIQPSAAISSIKDLKSVLENYEKSSKDSYESVVTNPDMEPENIKNELILQNDIIKSLNSVEILYEYVPKEKRNAVKSYVTTEFPNLINERIKYMEILLNDSTLNTLEKNSDLLQIKTLNVPMLVTQAENKFSEF